MDPKLEMTRQWMMLADDDLRLAELIIGDSEPVFWAAAFHAQQCAEKTLKGLLTFKDIRAGKTHDVGNLIKLSIPLLPGLEELTDQAKALTAYAVDSRYPVPHGNATEKETTEAIETARKIFQFVLNSLPDLGQISQEEK